MNEYLNELGAKAKAAAAFLAVCTEADKNKAILQIAKELEENKDIILRENAKDVDALVKKGVNLKMKDRLSLSEKRIKDMAEGALQVADLKDPVGEEVEHFTRPNGLEISKIRVPIGVVGIIYESRPNVTLDAAVLCLKVGNAVILRGGSEAINSNMAIVRIISKALVSVGFPESCVQLVEHTDRETAREFMKLNKYVDLLIPRGGAGLIRTVIENATIPVIETGTGNCHTYIASDADFDMADKIVINAKTQRPSVCNAMETLLIDEEIAERYIPRILPILINMGVEIRGCEKTCEIAAKNGIEKVVPATSADWETEYNDMILAVKVTEGLKAAIDHINKYGTRHSECIITKDAQKAETFKKCIDAACVYVNASTRFTDGFEFGFGAEIGISNQKLHARGPMGLKELTTVKYTIDGEGQIRE